jgi:hypothetical protein
MARIPESDIERLKREVSVERLAESRGVKLKRHGADLIGLCPFHDDHEPSLVITPSKNLWNCLGACRRARREKLRKMGSFRVYVGKPVENKRLTRKILDSGLLSSNRTASAR